MIKGKLIVHFVKFSILLCLITTKANALISIDSLPPNTQELVLKQFPNIKTQTYSPLLGDQIIQIIHSDSDVDKVSILKESNESYSVEVQRFQKVSSVDFSGNSAFSKSELKELFTVKEADRFSSELLVEAAEKIRQFYKSRAWLSPIVELEIIPDDNGNSKVLVKIKEGVQTKISKLFFNSPNEKLNKGLQKLLKSYIDEPLTNDIYQNIQKESREWLSENAYYRTELKTPQTTFNEDESSVVIQFDMDKYDKYLIRFEGNKAESTSALNGALALDTLYTSNPAIASDIADKIRNYYLTKGFARAEVSSADLATRDPNIRKLEIRISEGEKIIFKEVKVTGRLSHSDSWYYDFLHEHSSELIQNGHYSKEDLDAGLKNLVLQLQNEGHLTARLISNRIQYNDKKNAVTLYLNIDEGPLTTVKEVRFEGNLSYSNEVLLPLLKIPLNEPLRLDQIEIAISQIKNQYQDNGYIEMELLNEKTDLVQYNEDNTQASLVFKIQEGPQVRIGSIAIEGNIFTKNHVVLSELDLEEGEILTNRKMFEATGRLQRSGYFSAVEIKTLEENTQIQHRTLIVNIRERDPGVRIVGFGANNEQILTLRGYFGIAYRNLWGTGRGISLRVEARNNITGIKYLEKTITVGYLEPNFFAKRVRGRVNISRSSSVTDFDLRKITETNQTTYSLEYEFSPFVTGIFEVWSLATLKDSGLDSRIPVTNSLLDIATTGPSIDFDFRDNAFNPTQGTFTRIKTEYSSPSLGSTKTINYSKTNASFTHYLPYKKSSIVFANNIQLGYLSNLSTELNGGVPYNKKGFILGGRSTVRGFESGTSEVFPNNTDLGSDNYLLKSSASMYLLKSEVRFTVYGNLGGAIFYDGGAVNISGLKLADPYRDSAGFGIRYGTPFGPLNLEFAWKLDARPSEEPWRFHLSIGTF